MYMYTTTSSRLADQNYPHPSIQDQISENLGKMPCLRVLIFSYCTHNVVTYYCGFTAKLSNKTTTQ